MKLQGITHGDLILFLKQDAIPANEHYIENGWKVTYEASAEVFHSHNLSFKEQFSRNRLVGTFLKEHADELCGVKETSEGKKLASDVARQPTKEKRPAELAKFGLDCTARLIGNRAGRRKNWMLRQEI